jgi:hypothetical protein
MKYERDREVFLTNIRKIEKDSNSVEETINKVLKLLDGSYYVSTSPYGDNLAFMLSVTYNRMKNF